MEMVSLPKQYSRYPWHVAFLDYFARLLGGKWAAYQNGLVANLCFSFPQRRDGEFSFERYLQRKLLRITCQLAVASFQTPYQRGVE